MDRDESKVRPLAGVHIGALVELGVDKSWAGDGDVDTVGAQRLSKAFGEGPHPCLVCRVGSLGCQGGHG